MTINVSLREVIYMQESRADREVKGLVPQKSDVPYYLGLAGFWFFLVAGLIVAALTTNYFILVVFLIILGCCVVQLIYIIKSFKRDRSATGTAGNIVGILILVFELLLTAGVGYFAIAINFLT